MKLKAICAAFLAIMISAIVTPAQAYAADSVRVMLDGADLTFDAQPRIVGGRTMVPMRAVFEAMGASVEWDGAARTVTSRKDGTVISLTIGKAAAMKDGAFIALDAVPVIFENRTFVPLRFVAESFGADVEWDGDLRLVIITGDKAVNVLPSEDESLPVVSDLTASGIDTSLGEAEKLKIVTELENSLVLKYLTNSDDVTVIIRATEAIKGYLFENKALPDERYSLSDGKAVTIVQNGNILEITLR
jgi:hypothetical protein